MKIKASAKFWIDLNLWHRFKYILAKRRLDGRARTIQEVMPEIIEEWVEAQEQKGG